MIVQLIYLYAEWSLIDTSYITAALTTIQGWKARSYKGLQHMTRTVERCQAAHPTRDMDIRINTLLERLLEKHARLPGSPGIGSL